MSTNKRPTRSTREQSLEPETASLKRGLESGERGDATMREEDQAGGEGAAKIPKFFVKSRLIRKEDLTKSMSRNDGESEPPFYKGYVWLFEDGSEATLSIRSHAKMFSGELNTFSTSYKRHFDTSVLTWWFWDAEKDKDKVSCFIMSWRDALKMFGTKTRVEAIVRDIENMADDVTDRWNSVYAGPTKLDIARVRSPFTAEYVYARKALTGKHDVWTTLQVNNYRFNKDVLDQPRDVACAAADCYAQMKYKSEAYSEYTESDSKYKKGGLNMPVEYFLTILNSAQFRDELIPTLTNKQANRQITSE